MIISAVKIEKRHWKKNDITCTNIFAQNIGCGYTLEPPRRGGSNECPQSMFWTKNKKKIGEPVHTPVLLYKSGVKGVGVYTGSSRTCFPDALALLLKMHYTHSSLRLLSVTPPLRTCKYVYMSHAGIEHATSRPYRKVTRGPMVL